MSSNIKFSPFHCYEYANKSTFAKTLDFVSTPCRKILGGRNINVITHTTGPVSSTAKKVKNLILSLVFFPAGVLALTAMIVKLVLTPFRGEKKLIENAAAKTEEAATKFLNSVKDNKTTEAIAILDAHHEIVQKHHVYTKVKKLAMDCIYSRHDWDTIGRLLSHMDYKKATEFLQIAIRHELSKQIEEGNITIDAKNVIGLIEKSLAHFSRSQRVEMLEFLVTHTLKIEHDGDLTTNFYRLDILDDLIDTIVAEKKRMTKDPLKSALVEWDLLQLRQSACENQLLSQYHAILCDKEQMDTIHEIASRNRNACALKKMQEAITHDVDTKMSSYEEMQELIKNIDGLTRKAELYIAPDSPLATSLSRSIELAKDYAALTTRFLNSSTEEELNSIQEKSTEIQAKKERFVAELQDWTQSFQAQSTFTVYGDLKNTFTLSADLKLLETMKGLHGLGVKMIENAAKISR